MPAAEVKARTAYLCQVQELCEKRLEPLTVRQGNIKVRTKAITQERIILCKVRMVETSTASQELQQPW